jgi:hypothetical protein
MNFVPFSSVSAVLSLVAISSVCVRAVSVGQVDSFEDGTTQGWRVSLLGSPSPAEPLNILGGPAGTADNFLLLSSIGGSGPGSRLGVANFLSQWAGDYLASGVQSISMDINNLGTSDLHLRLAFSDPIVGPPENVAFSDEGISVPAGSGWTSVVFPIQASDLQAGLGDVTTALAHVTELRIYNSPTDNFPNPLTPIDAIIGLLGVDNIRATGATVPEQTSPGFLLGAAFVGIAAFQSANLRRQRG